MVMAVGPVKKDLNLEGPSGDRGSYNIRAMRKQKSDSMLCNVM